MKLSQAEVKFWLAEADSCIERQSKELKQRNNYPFLVHYYEGKEQVDAVHPHITANAQLAIINEYFPNTNALISETMYQNPDIIAEAQKPEAEKGAPLMESALTYGFDKTGALIENRLGLFDMLFAGYTGVEVDHIKDAGGDTPLSNNLQSEARRRKFQLFKKASDTKEAEENLEKAIPDKDEAHATNENTYVKRWDPLLVPLDWRAERLTERRYNLKLVWMSKAEFDAKYPAFKDKVGISGDMTYSRHKHHIHAKKVLLYEFQIKKRENVYTNLVIAPNYYDSEIDMWERPYITNGFNMKIGTLHKYGKLYPIAMAQINKKMQDEMNHYIRFMMEVAERNIPKYMIDKNKVKADGEAALRSTNVNDLVDVDGNPLNAVIPLLPTNLSIENKELMLLFKEQNQKGWSVPSTRLGEDRQVKFATELAVQEAGFQSKQIDIQEGLRLLNVEILETLKDIIVNFWDGEYFFKITGGEKPEWYIPQKDPITGIVLNPLTDILTGDYHIKVDIQKSLRPNIERVRNELILLLRELLSPNMNQTLLLQKKQISMDFIDKIIRKFDLAPETVFEDIDEATFQALIQSQQKTPG